MSRRRLAQHDEAHENHERWLLTYADMITLLLALFIVLFAMSTIDTQKFEAFKNSFRKQGTSNTPVLVSGSGILPKPGTSLISSLHTPTISNSPSVAKTATAALAQLRQQQAAVVAEDQTLSAAQRKIQAALAAQGLQGDVRFQIDAKGLHVRILTDQVLFNTDQATILPTGNTIIAAIAPAILSLPNNIDVEGHTDNQPVTGGPYPDNWALSYARAYSVGQELLNTFHIPANRLQETAYADTRPIASNATPAGRALNRRVEVLVESTVNATTP